jgi:hypothetical protein
VLESAAPVDVVVIALGVNDLKTRLSASAYEIAEGAGVLVDRVLASDAGPNARAAGGPAGGAAPAADVGGWAARDPARSRASRRGGRAPRERSRRFAASTRASRACAAWPSSTPARHVTSSDLDGIHWPPARLRLVALAVLTTRSTPAKAAVRLSGRVTSPSTRSTPSDRSVSGSVCGTWERAGECLR